MKKSFIVFIITIFLGSMVIAIPSVPNVFFGDVEYSGNSGMSLTNYEISASVGGYSLGVIGNVDSGNVYEVMVDPQGRTGEIIFYIGGVQAEPSGVYQMGEFTELNLIINDYPSVVNCGNNIVEPGEQCDGDDINFATCENVIGPGFTGNITCTPVCSFDISGCHAMSCGDGECNNGETCESCVEDCGKCPPNNGGGGGGGGSSGGSSNNDDTQTITPLNMGELGGNIGEDKELEVLGTYVDDTEESLGITGEAVVDFAKSGRGILLITLIFFIILLAVVRVLKKRS